MTDAAGWQPPEERALGLRVLGCPMTEVYDTVGEYLIGLLEEVWREGECFNGKRPFGNSGWEHDLYHALVQGGVVDGDLDGPDGRDVRHRCRTAVYNAIGTLQDFARAAPAPEPSAPLAPPETVELDSEIVSSLFEDDPGYEEGGWVKVADQEGGSRRWQKHVTMVLLRVEDGKLFGVSYELGLTEYQDPTFPWHDGPKVTLREIEARKVTRTVYRYRKG